MQYYLLQLAQTISTGAGGNAPGIPTLRGEDVVHNILNLAYFLAGLVAVIVIIIAGITYATSGGNAASMTKAKNMILYSVIGLIVVISAFAITNFITGRFA